MMTIRHSALASALALAAAAAGACAQTPGVSETGKARQAVAVPVPVSGCALSLDSITVGAGSTAVGITVTQRPAVDPTYGGCGYRAIGFGRPAGKSCTVDDAQVMNTTLPAQGASDTVSSPRSDYEYVIFEPSDGTAGSYVVYLNGAPSCDNPPDTPNAILCDDTIIENPSSNDCSALGTGGNGGAAGSIGTNGRRPHAGSGPGVSTPASGRGSRWTQA